jgi:hypothetical protein
VKSLLFTLVLAAAAAALASAQDDPTPVPTREPSLAERAEAVKRQAAAKDKGRDQKPAGRMLNNEDLKKAKGNVIYLKAPASPVPVVVSAAPSTPSMSDASDVPVAITKAPVGASGNMLRELDESRGRALRLRTTIDETQQALANGPSPEYRTVLEERLRSTMNELLQTQETIGALSERMRQSEPASSSKEK